MQSKSGPAFGFPVTHHWAPPKNAGRSASSRSDAGRPSSASSVGVHGELAGTTSKGGRCSRRMRIPPHPGLTARVPTNGSGRGGYSRREGT